MGVGEDVTIRELAELALEVVGYQGDTVWNTDMPHGTPRKLLDVSRLRGLGWQAGTSLKVGIGRTVEAYSQRGHRLREGMA